MTLVACSATEHRILSPKRYLLAKMVTSRHSEMQVQMSASDPERRPDFRRSRNGAPWNWNSQHRWLNQFDTRELHDLSPLLNVLGKPFAEIGR